MFSNRYAHILAPLFYGFCLLVIVKSFFDSTLLSQLNQPVLGDPAVDVLTYIGIYTGLFQTIVNSSVLTYIFDISLFILPLLLIFRPHWRQLAWIHWIIWIIYALIYNYYGTHQTHSMVGILILQIPFLFYQKKSFTWWWNGVRYYVLWMFFSAGMWKLIRGSAFQENQGYNIFLQNHVGAMIEKGYVSIESTIASFPTLLNFLFVVGVFMELLFVVGFFTKKWDRYLATLMILLIIGFRVIADATFIEWLILILPFLFPISLKEVTASHDPRDNV